jgi:hypothetical protein
VGLGGHSVKSQYGFWICVRYVHQGIVGARHCQLRYLREGVWYLQEIGRNSPIGVF